MRRKALHSPAAASGGAGRANRHLLALRRCAHARAAHRAQQGTAGCGEARSRAAENGSFCKSSRSQAPILPQPNHSIVTREFYIVHTTDSRYVHIRAISPLHTLEYIVHTRHETRPQSAYETSDDDASSFWPSDSRKKCARSARTDGATPRRACSRAPLTCIKISWYVPGSAIRYNQVHSGALRSNHTWYVPGSTVRRRVGLAAKTNIILLVRWGSLSGGGCGASMMSMSIHERQSTRSSVAQSGAVRGNRAYLSGSVGSMTSMVTKTRNTPSSPE